MSIVLEITPEARAVLTRLQRFPAALTAGIKRALNYENELSVGAIQRLRLSKRGPDTLGVVTNRLRSSVKRATARLGSDGTTIISSIGSNVRYAAIHEFGYRGPVQVKQHQRRRFVTQQVGGNAYLDPQTGRIRKSRKKIERTQTGVVTVRAHERQVDVKARAPFRRGIQDRSADYSRSISQAIVSAWGNPPAA